MFWDFFFVQPARPPLETAERSEVKIEGCRVAKYPEVKCSDRFEGVNTPGPHDQGPVFGVTPVSHHTITAFVVALCAIRYASLSASLAEAQIPLRLPVNLLSGPPLNKI